MPLYEYECEACERRFELIRKFSDPPVTTCPSCGGEVRKLPSSPAIQFKGSGWYITDYARKGATGGDGNGSKGRDSATDKGESAGSETSKSESPKGEAASRGDKASSKGETGASSSSGTPSKSS